MYSRHYPLVTFPIPLLISRQLISNPLQLISILPANPSESLGLICSSLDSVLLCQTTTPHVTQVNSPFLNSFLICIPSFLISPVLLISFFLHSPFTAIPIPFSFPHKFIAFLKYRVTMAMDDGFWMGKGEESGRNSRKTEKYSISFGGKVSWLLIVGKARMGKSSKNGCDSIRFNWELGFHWVN